MCPRREDSCTAPAYARIIRPADTGHIPVPVLVSEGVSETDNPLAMWCAGPGYVATPIWDRQEIAFTVVQYINTAYAASLKSFDEGIVEAVKKGHTPEQIARCVTLLSHRDSDYDIVQRRCSGCTG